MKKSLYLIVFISLSLMQISIAQKTMSLSDCIEAAMQNNINIKQRDWQVISAEIDHRQSRLARLPDLNGFVSHGINQGRNIDPFTNTYINQDITFANYGLTSSLLLFNGLSQYHSIRRNALNLEASQLETQQEKDNIRLSVVLQYLQVLSTVDQIQILRNQISTTEAQLKRLETLDRDGAISPVDISDLRGQFATEKLNLLDAENAQQNAAISLFQLMGIAYDRTVTFSRSDFDESPIPNLMTTEELLKRSVDNLALIKAAQLRTASAGRGLKAAKAGLSPSLSFNAGIFSNISSAARRDIFLGDQTVSTSDYVIFEGTQLPVFKTFPGFNSEKIPYLDQFRNNYSTTFSLNLQIPILNGWQTRRQIELASLQEQQAIWIEDNTKIQLQQLVEQAHLNQATAFTRYELSTEQVDAFESSFRANEIRFNQGVINSVEYMISKNNLDQARLRQTMALYDWYLRKEILVFYGAGN
jgi:outer membrane protein